MTPKKPITIQTVFDHTPDKGITGGHHFKIDEFPDQCGTPDGAIISERPALCWNILRTASIDTLRDMANKCKGRPNI